jgi:metal-responsive CopG/Arc/MetJ family transcriptional regulator
MKYDRVPLSKPIPVKIPHDVLKRIDAISKRIGEPRSTVMRMAMRIGLDSLEKALETKPPNLSSLIYPSHKDEYSVAEDAPKKKKNG